MLCFDRIGVSKGTDFNKTSALKECDIYHYQYFLNKGSKFQPNICNRCYDLSMISMNLSIIAVLNIEEFGYCCIISRISKNEAIKLMQNVALSKKRGTL